MRPDQETILAIGQSTLMYPYRLWGYGEAIAMDALLEAAEQTGCTDFERFVERCLKLWLLKTPSLGPADHVAPGKALLKVVARTGDERLRDRAMELGRLLLQAYRSPRGIRVHRPELSQWVWVDCIYTDGPFLCELARSTGDRSYVEAAVEYAREYVGALRDSSEGLFVHGRDERSGRTSPYFWGRGNGWALLGLVDLVAELPDRTQGRDSLIELLNGLFETLEALQDDSGHWHTILDYPESRLEPSISAMFVAGVLKARSKRLLAKDFQGSLERAVDAFLSGLDTRGQFPVSEATAVGEYSYYNELPWGVFPWGQGPALLAACRLAQEGGAN